MDEEKLPGIDAFGSVWFGFLLVSFNFGNSIFWRARSRLFYWMGHSVVWLWPDDALLLDRRAFNWILIPLLFDTVRLHFWPFRQSYLASFPSDRPPDHSPVCSCHLLAGISAPTFSVLFVCLFVYLGLNCRSNTCKIANTKWVPFSAQHTMYSLWSHG